VSKDGEAFGGADACREMGQCAALGHEAMSATAKQFELD
jgi:hypothetical protein